jgi:hypothetical protein
MGRPVEAVGEGAQGFVFVCERGAQLNHVEPGARRELDGKVERFPGHQRTVA